MRDIIINLLGEYTPLTGPDGEFIGGLASIDFTWIVGATLFVIALIGVFCLTRTLLRSLLN